MNHDRICAIFWMMQGYRKENLLFQNSVQTLQHYGAHGHHDGKPAYHVFHVEFERVEIPFIIALWIFVSSLAKIGKFLTLLGWGVAESARTFFGWLFLHEKRGLEVQNFVTFPNSL